MGEQDTKLKKSQPWWPWFLVGLAVLVVLVFLVGLFGEEEASQSARSSEQQASAKQVSTEPSQTITASLTAQYLYKEREANATRYDAQYKGKWVRVRGQVVSIDNNVVTLGVDTGFGIDTSGFLGVDLSDLSKDEQISLNKGDEVVAVCKVGDYILGSIRMKDCELN